MVAKLLKLRFLILFFILLWLPVTATDTYAVFTLAPQSNKVITKVGNPKSSPPPKSTGLVAAAEDLYSGYNSCNNGSTYPSSALSQCLGQFLTNKGYSQDLINDVINLDNFTCNGGGCQYCVQCAGFVTQAIILSDGGTDPRIWTGGHILINGNSPAYWDSSGNLVHWSSMNNNGHTYTYRGYTTPQPGDIAINPGDNPDDWDSTFGHISIVKSVGSIYFTAVEANFEGCTATDNISSHPIEDYVFFREQ